MLLSPIKRFWNLLKVYKLEIRQIYVYAIFIGFINLTLPLQVSKAGGRVTIRVAEQDGAAMFEVLDEGPGVGDDADRLFEMFYTARKHGVGLGLALVKQIVERHDGRVIAVDREEGGACFRVILPNGVDVTRRTTSRPEGRALPSERNTQVPSQTRVTQSIPPPPLVTRSDDPTRER